MHSCILCSFSAAFAIWPVRPKFPIPCADFIRRPAFFAHFFCNALCHPRACAAVSHSHSDQVVRTLHPNTCVSTLCANFLYAFAISRLFPSSRFLAQTLLTNTIRCTKTGCSPLGDYFQALLSGCTILPMISCSSFALSKCLQVVGQHRRTRVHTGRDASSVFVWVMSENRRHFALVDKKGVLCIISSVTTSYAIKRVTPSSANLVCTATACWEIAQPSALWHQAILLAVVSCFPCKQLTV